MIELIWFILGLFVGSFLNLLIDRLPQGENVIFGRSRCDHCGRDLTWRELIPVVSWLIQGGRSSCCRRVLSAQYPWVELATAAGFALLATHGNPALSAVVGRMGLFSSFLVIF